jgi:hypothetical protein
MAYGFHAEMEAKYAQTARGMYTSCLALFAVLPLAAQVDSVLVMHGGLFRRPAPRTRSGGTVTAEVLCVGSLEDLRTASSGAHTRVCSHCVSCVVSFTVSPSQSLAVSPAVSPSLCLPHCLSRRLACCVSLTASPSLRLLLCLPHRLSPSRLLCLPHCVSLTASPAVSPSPSLSRCAGGPDPDGLGASALASDVLWSDPMMQPGMRCVQPGVLPVGVWGQWACSTTATQLHSLSHRRAGRQCRENEARGVGVLFGPDVTQQFLVHAQPRPWC